MAKVSYPYLGLVQQVILENRASFIAVLYCRALISSEKKTKQNKTTTTTNKQTKNKKTKQNKKQKNEV